MRSSTLLTLLGATLAVATPLAHDHLHKKAIVYDIVTDIVYVTVLAGEEPVTATTVTVAPVEASPTYVPPPPPSTTSTTSTTPTPEPTTEAPAPVVEAAAPTTEAPAPVVEAPEATTEAPVTTKAQTAASTPAASTSDDPLSSTGIAKHNTCRAAHSASSVTWNATLADAAQKLASSCVWGHDMTIDGGGYGQNIASQGSSSSSAWTLESALENAIIDEWYSEESLFTNLYGQESPSGSGDFLHFTQIVWKNSLEIGCAVAACPTANSIFPGMYAWYTVCNYYPQGNVEGQFAENVLSS